MGALARPDHRHPPAPVITQPRDPSLAINHRLKLMVISMFEVPLVHGHALCPSPRSVGRWERDTAFAMLSWPSAKRTPATKFWIALWFTKVARPARLLSI